jgi:serine/threonine-protein kinase
MNPPDDLANDARVKQLVQFDEALRLGREPLAKGAVDPELKETQDFLRRLQATWKRTPQRIGPYLLIRSLGQGAFGPTYFAEDAARQPFVLKTLWPDLSGNESTLQRLLNEAKIVSDLRHAGIAELKTVSSPGTLFYAVWEYLPGRSLAEWRLRRPQPLAWPVAAQTVAKLADILDAAHTRGIVHGNLKPTNLFLAPGAEATPINLHEISIRIADLGLAKVILQSRVPGLPWPMPQYLAPEQLGQRGQAAEPASDIYALGVLLYELLTGRLPIKGQTRDEMVRALRETTPPAPCQLGVDLPVDLDALAMKCLHRDPRQRPVSARQLVEALRALIPIVEETPKPAWWKQWLGWM